MSPRPEISFQLLSSLAQRHSLELVAVQGVEHAEAGLRAEAARLQQWQSEGFAGEMHYMLREQAIFSGLRHFLPEIKTIISFVVPYSTDEDFAANFPNSRQPTPDGFGRVARYAWGKDYHRVLKRKLKKLLAEIEVTIGSESGSLKYRIFSDAVPLLERSLASAGKLGFIGKNTMLIRPGLGSFTFLAEILSNLNVSERDVAGGSLPGVLRDSSCGSCQRCIDLCPTGAIVSPRRLDARRCISYLTIEKRGQLTEAERRDLGEWIFGCDICQDVCPFNHRGVERGKVAEFSRKFGVGPFVNLKQVLSLSTPKLFAELFAGTPLMRTGREGLLRNACCVIANTRAFLAIPSLKAALADSSSVVSESARSALVELLPDADGQDKRLITAALNG